MQITIQPHRTHLRRETIQRMERRLLFVLSRFANVIRTVRVRLVDINGPKGGPDKHCLIIARFRKGGEVVIQGKGENNTTVLYRCADRLNRAVERKLKRSLKAPIRKIRRMLHSERNDAFVMEEQACEQMEINNMTLCLPDGRV